MRQSDILRKCMLQLWYERWTNDHEERAIQFQTTLNSNVDELRENWKVRQATRWRWWGWIENEIEKWLILVTSWNYHLCLIVVIDLDHRNIHFGYHNFHGWHESLNWIKYHRLIKLIIIIVFILVLDELAFSMWSYWPGHLKSMIMSLLRLNCVLFTY